MARVDYKKCSDEELLKMLSGNKQTAALAFEAIYGKYATRVYTYCQKVMRNEEVAQDIFQETFTRFIENAQHIKESSNLCGYMIRIARNLCLNEKSRNSSRNTIPVEDYHLFSNVDVYESRQIGELLDAALDELPPNFKEALVLKEYMNMSYAEISETMGISLASVRINIFRAKNKLRELMDPVINDLQRNS